MRRLFGTLLILYAAVHTAARLWVADINPGWTGNLLWFIAAMGFLIAGIGLLGVDRVDRQWRPIAVVGAIASLGLIARYAYPVLMIGAAIDGALLIASIPFVRETLVRQLGMPEHLAPPSLVHVRQRERPLGIEGRTAKVRHEGAPVL